MGRGRMTGARVGEYNAALGRKLRKAAGLRGVSHRALAAETGIPERTLRDILSGSHSATAFNIARLCSVLDLDANAVLGVRRMR